MSIMTTVSRIAERMRGITEEEMPSYMDPDGYYFPRINAAIQEGKQSEAKRLLDQWKMKKTGVFIAQKRTQEEIAGITMQYNAKMSEIQGINGTANGDNKSTMIAGLLAVVVLGYLLWRAKK
jgi:hypothetical protein